VIGLDPALGLPAALGLRLAAAGLTIVAARRPRLAAWVAFGGAILASAVTGLTAAAGLAAGAPVRGVLLLHRASGLSLTFAVDGLSAWFLLVLSIVAIPVALFSIGYVGHPPRRARTAFIGAAFNFLVGALELVFVAGDAITFLCAWELMTLVNAALVATDHKGGEVRRAAFLYLVLSHVGTGCLVAGFLTLAALSGSLAFSAMLAGGVASGGLRHVLFALFLVGFGVKAGVVPLHVWLPEAHPAAPTSISALMSSVVIKAGIYGLARVCIFGLGTPALSWGVLLVGLGAVSAVLGVLYALMQHDLKRLLAYHSIENIGIILLGLGAGTMGLAYGRPDLAAMGLVAGLFHVLNHAVFKGLLFLGAGSVVTATGTRQIEQYGGLLRLMPWTGLCFLVGAMAISGLPPLNGFASEWLTFQSFLFGFLGSDAPLVRFLFPVGGAVLALTTALAAACFVKAFGICFLALPRTEAAEKARESAPLLIVPQAFLVLLCVGLGVFPGVVVRVLHGLMASVPGGPMPAGLTNAAFGMTSGVASFDQVVPAAAGAALIVAVGIAAWVARRAVVRPVPTWGCGGELSARTEYTATAFSKPLMMIFRAVYRPTRTVESLATVSPYFPDEVRYRSEIEPTFERYVYGPLARAVLRIAGGMRVLQAGSLHAYLSYVIVLVVGLVLFVWWTA